MDISTVKTPLVDDYKDHQDHFPSADWFVYWTIERMQKEFSNFQFKGVGWYRSKGYEDTLLVLKGPDLRYWIYCWNDRDPRDQMIKLLELNEIP